MNTYKTVIFDMDGLMFDTEKISYQGYQDAADHLGIEFNQEIYLKWVGKPTFDNYKEMLERTGDQELTEAFFKEGTERINIKFNQEETPKKYGLDILLTHLRRQGIEIAVASSFHRSTIEHLLTKNGVMKFVDYYVSIDEVENDKPAPDIFIRTQALSQSAPEDCLILEDSLAGVDAAYQAGIDVIMVPDLIGPNAKALDQVKAVVPNLKDIIPYLKK